MVLGGIYWGEKERVFWGGVHEWTKLCWTLADVFPKDNAAPVCFYKPQEKYSTTLQTGLRQLHKKTLAVLCSRKWSDPAELGLYITVNKVCRLQNLNFVDRLQNTETFFIVSHWSTVFSCVEFSGRTTRCPFCQLIHNYIALPHYASTSMSTYAQIHIYTLIRRS